MSDIDVTDVEIDKTQAQVVPTGGENPPRHCQQRRQWVTQTCPGGEVHQCEDDKACSLYDNFINSEGI